MSLPPTVDPELLRAFVAVVDAGGFSRAAGRLLRGQSAVSLQIKRLEDRLGTRLLERGPRGVKPTPQGEAILHQARRILALHAELVAAAREPEVAGVVRLGAPEDFATARLPRLLGEFARAHPRVALEVTCELTLDLLARFEAGGLDLALLKREPASSLGGTRVWRERLVWVAGERERAAEAPLPLVCSPIPCVYRGRATAALDAAGRPWRVAYCCGSLAGSLAAVRAGLGVTVLPADMVPPDLLTLDEGAGLPPLPDTEIALVAAPDLTPPAARLRDFVIGELERGAGR
ncbi:LysR substrate-binding domain-containing protein [Rubellimicrobium sp. CFH 75288]|uniref:LysR substrate-binding domain-containing protein n=1 Tax=Rubellimicrobium sp. CFH 75288 TaxID=2697034 RepID=UPI0014133800|nr:LysR substrate-binding domain-containing protein [Rubellimicrobium sp. CFH 75288]NAZ36849.1 LysR family transcriptional regulator [Rubellimicrobium sp. CFH 75288]